MHFLPAATDPSHRSCAFLIASMARCAKLCVLVFFERICCCSNAWCSMYQKWCTLFRILFFYFFVWQSSSKLSSCVQLCFYSQKSLVMRIRMNYKINDKDVLEEGQISNFPRNLWRIYQPMDDGTLLNSHSGEVPCTYIYTWCWFKAKFCNPISAIHQATDFDWLHVSVAT